MKETDIRILEITVRFTEEAFRIPLHLSTGSINNLPYADVRILIENRHGSRAEGIGGILLSDLWAFPEPSIDHASKDRIFRHLVFRWKELLQAASDYGDPFQHAHHIEACLPGLLHQVRMEYALSTDIPRLAGLVSWSPFDAALHDGWAKAAHRSAYDMYTQDFLNLDLGVYLGPDWRGRYPAEYLQKPVKAMWIQHVVGGKDPLTPLEAAGAIPIDDGLPVALTDWIRHDRVRWFKLKTSGSDIEHDLERILNVYRVAEETAKKCGIPEPILFEIDPNEGYANPEPLLELLGKLKERSERAYQALQYIEQPTSRELSSYSYTLHEISRLKPVLADESLSDLSELQEIERIGWNGVALKTCKGHSHSLITYCWAKQKGNYISLQDLTNPGIASVHSAGLCSRLGVSWDCFEANSRQYLPFSRLNEQQKYPDVFAVRDGKIHIYPLQGLGLY